MIKVCMGGKCKKSGSEMSLDVFEERISKPGMGCEREAVGCKCWANVEMPPMFECKETKMDFTAA